MGVEKENVSSCCSAADAFLEARFKYQGKRHPLLLYIYALLLYMCPQAIKFLSAVDGRMSSLTTKKYFINKTMHFVHSCAVCAGAQELMRVLERNKITQYKK